MHTSITAMFKYPVMLAGLVVAFAGACVAQAMHAGDDKEQCVLAVKLFASSNISSTQLTTLVSMPWLGSPSGSTQLFAASQQTTPSQPQTAVLNQARIDSQLLQAAAPVLGFPELASADFSNKQGPHGIVHKALQAPQASVQAAAAVLLPLNVANTAKAAQASSRGHATVGIRLLQKSLDCLLSIVGADSQRSSRTGTNAKIKSGVAFALEGFVSLQHVVEHRLVALSLAAKHLLFLSPCKGTQFDADAASDSNLASAACNGLLCWPPWPVEKLTQLPVTGHGGAAVSDKVLQSLVKVFMSDNAAAHQQVSTLYCLCTPSINS